MKDLDKSLKAIVSYIGADPLATEEWAVDELKSLIKSTLLDALPKESHINYHIEDGIKYLDQADIGISMQWEKGYNHALKDIKDSLEGIV